MKKYPEKTLPTVFAQYMENLLSAFRTAGALLIGNSLLVYLEIVGRNPNGYKVLLLVGGITFIAASTPIAVLQRNQQIARKALEGIESSQRKD